MRFKRHQVWEWLAGETPLADKPYPYQADHEQKHLLFFRCLTDQRLLTDRLISQGRCIGHRSTNHVILTWREYFLIWIGYIR